MMEISAEKFWTPTKEIRLLNLWRQFRSSDKEFSDEEIYNFLAKKYWLRSVEEVKQKLHALLTGNVDPLIQNADPITEKVDQVASTSNAVKESANPPPPTERETVIHSPPFLSHQTSSAKILEPETYQEPTDEQGIKIAPERENHTAPLQPLGMQGDEPKTVNTSNGNTPLLGACSNNPDGVPTTSEVILDSSNQYTIHVIIQDVVDTTSGIVFSQQIIYKEKPHQQFKLVDELVDATLMYASLEENGLKDVHNIDELVDLLTTEVDAESEAATSTSVSNLPQTTSSEQTEKDEGERETEETDDETFDCEEMESEMFSDSNSESEMSDDTMVFEYVNCDASTLFYDDTGELFLIISNDETDSNAEEVDEESFSHESTAEVHQFREEPFEAMDVTPAGEVGHNNSNDDVWMDSVMVDVSLFEHHDIEMKAAPSSPVNCGDQVLAESQHDQTTRHLILLSVEPDTLVLVHTKPERLNFLKKKTERMIAHTQNLIKNSKFADVALLNLLKKLEIRQNYIHLLTNSLTK